MSQGLVAIIALGAVWAASANAAPASYTPGTPQLAQITNGSSAAPWNEWQGDSAYSLFSFTSPGTVLPTYTPGGTTDASGFPNLAVV
ncbi:MAG TPA: hypothetical protein VME01_02690, partial [Solirubrobacteraceae bacterium]|nr:hypothetical protein [Solirubrobacteraceae bacterium]